MKISLITVVMLSFCLSACSPAKQTRMVRQSKRIGSGAYQLSLSNQTAATLIKVSVTNRHQLMNTHHYFHLISQTPAVCQVDRQYQIRFTGRRGNCQVNLYATARSTATATGLIHFQSVGHVDEDYHFSNQGYLITAAGPMSNIYHNGKWGKPSNIGLGGGSQVSDDKASGMDFNSYMIDDNNWQTASSLGIGAIYQLLIDQDGNLYAGGNGNKAGSNFYFSHHGSVSTHSIDIGQVYALAMDGNGVIYAGGSQGFAIYRQSRWTVAKNAKIGLITALAVDQSGQVYVGGCGQGVNTAICGEHFNPLKKTFNRYADGKWQGASNAAGIGEICALAVGSDGSVYASGSGNASGQNFNIYQHGHWQQAMRSKVTQRSACGLAFYNVLTIKRVS